MALNIRKCVEKVINIEPAIRFAKSADGDGFNHNRRRVSNGGQLHNRQSLGHHSVGSNSPDRNGETGYRHNYPPERSSARSGSVRFVRQRWDRRDR